MALTSYSANNLVIEEDYNVRFNEILVGDPEVTVEFDLSGNPAMQINSWYRTQQEETARWRWVGMNYDTAQNCANAVRNALTFEKYTWQFGTYLSGTTLLYGYYKDKAAPVLESDVAVVKNGNGSMYDVVVDACLNYENFTKGVSTAVASTQRLNNYLNSLDGWSSYPSGWNVGHGISAAGAGNIVIEAAPTRKREFKIAGQDIMPVGGEGGLSSVTFPIWYKCTDTYTCQVKYPGMTLAACRNLRNSLNASNGWWYSYHPYVYKYDASTSAFVWQEDVTKTLYQCQNHYKATKGDGNMWTAELNLYVEIEEYTKNPSQLTGWSWPSIWSNAIPGLANYL